MVDVLLTAMAQAQPIAPPVPQQVADCARPTYATDQLICTSSRLRALDTRLAASLAGLPEGLTTSPLIEDQDSWFRRSRLCAFQPNQAACVEAAYRERLAVVAAIATPPGGRPLTCKMADGSSATAIRGDAIAVLHHASIVAVALPDSSNWRPFVSYKVAEDAVTVWDNKGNRVARCQ